MANLPLDARLLATQCVTFLRPSSRSEPPVRRKSRPMAGIPVAEDLGPSSDVRLHAQGRLSSTFDALGPNEIGVGGQSPVIMGLQPATEFPINPGTVGHDKSLCARPCLHFRLARVRVRLSAFRFFGAMQNTALGSGGRLLQRASSNSWSFLAEACARCPEGADAKNHRALLTP